jgi:hypothetical protein
VADFRTFNTKFNDPSNSLGNRKKALTLRLWSLTYMTDPIEEIAFKAFITDFTDEYSSNWNEETVYGRMDPLAVFQNTQRAVNISLDVPASSEGEARENLAKMEKIIQGLYPVYEQYNGVPVLQAAPLWKIKLANFITSTANANDTAKSGGLTCKLDGFTFQPDFEPGVFVDKNGLYLPKNIKASFSAMIFHDHTVGHNQNREFLSKYEGYPYAVPFTKVKPDIKKVTDVANEMVAVGEQRAKELLEFAEEAYKDITGLAEPPGVNTVLKEQSIKEATKPKNNGQ